MEKSVLRMILAIVSVCLFSEVVAENEILGCGGFIKSENAENLDFGQIEVKLLTKGGTLKDKTDCSPSNGYYFLPVYEKGDYVLKLSHPPGWSFEQNEIGINFNGETDPCSQGKDVNFVFKGFGITGRVGVIGQRQGAPDIHVELTQQGKSIGKTQTDRFGVFSFSPIQPGKYTVKVSHDKWHFGSDTADVEVTTENMVLKEGLLVVSGFDVIGKVTSDKQAFPNLGLAVFPANSGTPTNEPKCTLAKPTDLQHVTNTNNLYRSAPICSTNSAPDGSYTFRGLAPGKYLVKAFFENRALKFNLEPKEIEVEVVKDTLHVPSNFDITGFDVHGRILRSADGSGVANAKIKLNGAHVVTTDSSGLYVLGNVKAGTYTIQVTADDIQFTDHTVKISGSNPHIPDIIASAFKVCGSVISPKAQKIAITKHASTFHIETNSAADGSGQWCSYLPSGKFTIEVLVGGAEKQQGLQFFPLKHEIEVHSQPIGGITFSQLKAKVSGRVKCLSDAGSLCQSLKVNLIAMDGTGRVTTTTISASGDYQFDEILPGKYEVTALSTLICWEQARVPLDVKSDSETAPTILQSGYKMSVISSHSAKMTYTMATGGETVPAAQTINLKSGLNEFCVLVAGAYNVKFSSCHSVDTATTLPTSIKTGTDGPFNVAFNKHRNGFKIVPDHKEAFQVQIEHAGQKTQVLDWQELEQLSGNIYRHVMDVKDGESVQITPLSETLLFRPATFKLIGENDCAEDRFTFKGRKGLIINGRIQPAIKDVRITLKLKGEELKQTTNAEGAFKFGPIDSDEDDYEVIAEKESYVFSSYDKSLGVFKAHKLCEIVVTVKDEQGQLLNGVLLSLSGGESYRKNLISAEGVTNFHSLSPSQYFLKPILKEYKFEPNSKMVQIADGETVNVELIGKRVAYSAFGSVTSLNGDPFLGISLEAFSELCNYHQEEATSEANGAFRIRGLQPGCEYTIRAKELAEGPSNVDRTIPMERVIQVEKTDVENLKFIAISPVGFVDVAVRVNALALEHYKTLRVSLYKKGNNENPVYNGRVESPLATKSRTNPGVMVFFPRIPFDGKPYVIELTTTLSKNKDQHHDDFHYEFLANRSSIFHEFHFEPAAKASEPELNQNSIAALVLLCIVTFAFLKQKLFLELVGMAFDKISGVVQDLIEKNRRKDNKAESAVLNDRDLDSLVKSINDVRRKKPKKM